MVLLLLVLNSLASGLVFGQQTVPTVAEIAMRIAMPESRDETLLTVAAAANLLKHHASAEGPVQVRRSGGAAVGGRGLSCPSFFGYAHRNGRG